MAGKTIGYDAKITVDTAANPVLKDSEQAFYNDLLFLDAALRDIERCGHHCIGDGTAMDWAGWLRYFQLAKVKYPGDTLGQVWQKRIFLFVGQGRIRPIPIAWREEALIFCPETGEYDLACNYPKGGATVAMPSPERKMASSTYVEPTTLSNRKFTCAMSPGEYGRTVGGDIIACYLASAGTGAVVSVAVNLSHPQNPPLSIGWEVELLPVGSKVITKITS